MVEVSLCTHFWGFKKPYLGAVHLKVLFECPWTVLWIRTGWDSLSVHHRVGLLWASAKFDQKLVWQLCNLKIAPCGIRHRVGTINSSDSKVYSCYLRPEDSQEVGEDYLVDGLALGWDRQHFNWCDFQFIEWINGIEDKARIINQQAGKKSRWPSQILGEAASEKCQILKNRVL